jgi:hypothetical protein
MSYGLSVPTSGALGWWDTSYDVSAPGGNKAPEAAANTTSSTNDSWGGYWQGLLTTAVNYSIAKDAAKSGVHVQAPATQYGPAYVPAQQQIPSVLLLAGIGLVVYLAVKD